MNKTLYIIILPIVLFIGCHSTGDRNKAISDSITIDDDKREIKKSAHAIFYNMFLPCEMVYLFEENDLIYNPKLVNPVSNLSKYNTNNKKALNLGIYGVDMGYIKMCNQLQEVKEYSVVINKLSNDLGIPREYINNAMNYLDNQQVIDNIDSMYQMTCELFEVTDSYLNNTQRQSTSALIILGGWIEALYITVYLAEDEVNQKIMKRVAQQKYSLNSIISLLRMYEDNLLVTNYLVLLNKLKSAYEEVGIYFQNKDDITIDTVNKRIYTEKSEVSITLDQFLDIRKAIINIRNKMVE